MKTLLKKYIRKCGSKELAAHNLKITVRYMDMILAGHKPSARLKDLVKYHLLMD